MTDVLLNRAEYEAGEGSRRPVPRLDMSHPDWRGPAWGYKPQRCTVEYEVYGSKPPKTVTHNFENVVWENEDAVIHIRDVLGPRELGVERFQHASWALKTFRCDPM